MGRRGRTLSVGRWDMQVGKLVPVLGLMAGTAALGAATAYGSVRAAGESGGGMVATYGGMLGGNPLVVGSFTGIAAGAVLGRLASTKPYVGGSRSLLLMPAGIAGAALGGFLARGALQRGHAEEYRRQDDFIDATMERTRDVLREAGAPESALDRVPERYDRSFFNASYAPPLGPFGDRITVGRNSTNGEAFAVDDVIAHEFAHKVIHELAPGMTRSIGGDGKAIHESVADTVAMAVDTEDWLVGEDSFEGGIRSFSHPEVRGSAHGDEVKPAPITREEYGSGPEAHLGAGVGNKAAWRIGEALGRDTMLRIYVAALERGELGMRASYEDLARVVRAAAVDLYGPDSREASIVDASWTTAGY